MRTRLRELSWKQKIRALLVTLGAMLFLIGFFSVRPTLDARARCSELNTLLENSRSAPAEGEALRLELLALDQLHGAHTSVDSSAHHEELLALITGYCSSNDILLREFPSSVVYLREQWQVETHSITVEGSFIPLVNFLEHLHHHTSGKIVSAGFRTKKDSKTKTTSLLLTVYVQHIRNRS